jgi:CelD/BcsL family acetyltransferase involved in cellulose biosynthesis
MIDTILSNQRLYTCSAITECRSCPPAVDAENKLTRTACQTLAQSMSWIYRAATDTTSRCLLLVRFGTRPVFIYPEARREGVDWTNRIAYNPAP